MGVIVRGADGLLFAWRLNGWPRSRSSNRRIEESSDGL